MARNVIFGAAALVLWGLTAAGAHAQDPLLDELYGQGVHSYFSRDYQAAETAFNAAIDGGSRDPRAFYFRGLTLSVQGKSKEAAADFKKGAEFEVAATDRAYGVARSLERVQGPVRRSIELERQTARVASRNKVVERNKTRYEQLEKAEKTVVRGGEGTKPAPGDLPKPPAGSKDPDDPFGDVPGATPAEPKKPATPEDPAPAPEDPPAEKPEAPAAPEKPEDDPFGEVKPAAPKKPAPPAPKPEMPEDDPFGDEKPAAPKKPAAPAPKPDDDPFGEKPAAPAAEEPAAEEPAEKPEAEKPADAPPAEKKPPADDPFADDPPPAKKSGGGLLGSMWRAVGKSLPSDGKAAPAPAAPVEPAKPATVDDDPFK